MEAITLTHSTEYPKGSPPAGLIANEILSANHQKHLRIALYSHDTMGLGHTRRNLLIAQTLAKAGISADLLLITGAVESARFAKPPRVDYLTLPSWHKDTEGCYAPRDLDMTSEDFAKLRGQTIWATLKVFKPDLLIVDNVPKGTNGELRRALKKLRKRGRTRCILGLRDILDSPEQTKKQWQKQENAEAIERFYDAIWIYGDKQVFDVVSSYELSDNIAKRVSYLGYFDQRARLSHSPNKELSKEISIPNSPIVLCQVGGGQDGAALAEAFMRTTLPDGWAGVLITGPFMPADFKKRLQILATKRSDIQVLEFLSEPTHLLKRVERVISMGGYNTVMEALSFEKPLLVVPRVKPRLEQLVRAERLQSLGVLELLHPNDLSPKHLADWLNKEVKTPNNIHTQISFNGQKQLCWEVKTMFDLVEEESQHAIA